MYSAMHSHWLAILTQALAQVPAPSEYVLGCTPSRLQLVNSMACAGALRFQNRLHG